jgi:steroid delta-isomerase-like uncharacterized protein
VRQLLIFGTLCAALLCGLGGAGDALPVTAQEATPDASTVHLSPLLQQWVDAFNAKDSEAIAALYTEDGIVEDVPTGRIARGREEIAAFSREAAAGPDFTLEIVGAHEGEDFAVLEYLFTVADMGTEAPVTVRGVYLFELDGDQITRTADYFDVAGVLVQLGLLDMDELMGGMATPTP